MTWFLRTTYFVKLMSTLIFVHPGKSTSLLLRGNGRPSLDPLVLFKMMFVGYLFGIRSERQLEKEIQVNRRTDSFLA
jgi:transposase